MAGKITEEMLPELFELWDKTGKSATEIAMHLSAKYHLAITRNMVIGKVHRRREAGRIKARRVEKLKPEERRAKQKEDAAAKPAALPKPKPAPKPKTDPLYSFAKVRPTDMATHAARAIAELCGCRFPLGEVGDPDFHFCNAEPVEGRPYCRTHCAVAYNGIPQPKPKLRLVASR